MTQEYPVSQRYQYAASREDRLDRLLAEALAEVPAYRGLSRSQLKRWIEGGQVTVDERVVEKAGALVRVGSVISVSVLDPSPMTLPSFDHALDIRFEDEHLMVIDKPAGLSMHPGAGNVSTTLVNALLGYFRGKGDIPEALQKDAVVRGASVQRPGIVHRLDKDTTGLVVVAKTVQAHAALAAQFAARTVGRRYKALAFCTPRGKRLLSTTTQGTISAPLSRHPERRKEWSVTSRGGKRAVTHWRVDERLGYGCVLELALETGRTHQIRIHLSHIGSPVIGDRTYGDFSGLPMALKRLHEAFGRQALHAALLVFEHPQTGDRLRFESPIPQDMRQLIDAFRSFGSGSAE